MSWCTALKDVKNYPNFYSPYGKITESQNACSFIYTFQENPWLIASYTWNIHKMYLLYLFIFLLTVGCPLVPCWTTLLLLLVKLFWFELRQIFSFLFFSQRSNISSLRVGSWATWMTSLVIWIQLKGRLWKNIPVPKD